MKSAFVSLTLAQTTTSGVSTSRGASTRLPGTTSVNPALSRATLPTVLSSSVPSSRPNGAATSRTSSSVTSSSRTSSSAASSSITSSSVTSSSSQVPAPSSRSSTSSASRETSLSSISSSVQSSVSSTSNTQPPVATPSSTTASSTTSSVTTPLLTSAPTATLPPTRTTSTTSGTLTTTVSGGATIIVAAGVVVVGGPGGGTIVVNGVATPIAAGATQVAGDSSSNQDPQKSDDPVTTQPTSSRPTTSSSSTSSSSSSSTSAGCLRYQDPDYPPPDNGDTQNGQGDFNKRDLRLSGRPIAGRIAVPDIQPELEKRAATFGVFSTPRGPTCTIATRVVQPTYPGPGAITRMEALPTGDPGRNEALFQTAKYWFIGRQDCGALPTYTSVGSNALPTAGSNGDPVGIGGKTKSEASVDHVWELKFLNDFIESQLSSTSFDCDDLNTVFMSNDASRPAGATTQSRLQTIFDQLPGNGFPDLAGMLQSTNNIKGTVFTPGGLRRLSPRNALLSEAEAALFTLQDISNVFAICNDPAVSQLFSNTNRRIFEAL
ncbi:hypothetical protein B0O99DRAFT_56259 [Bisporella sp. PMI_857]|nr:hypothetical protein B0O99DRAFT_56259 [Bisporella sp. PMI_857]